MDEEYAGKNTTQVITVGCGEFTQMAFGAMSSPRIDILERSQQQQTRHGVVFLGSPAADNIH